MHPARTGTAELQPRKPSANCGVDSVGYCLILTGDAQQCGDVDARDVSFPHVELGRRRPRAGSGRFQL